MSDPTASPLDLRERFAHASIPDLDLDAYAVLAGGRRRRRRQRMVRAGAVLGATAIVATAVTVLGFGRPAAHVPADPGPTVTQHQLPTAVDPVPILREEVVEVPVPGRPGEVLYAHLRPKGIPGLGDEPTNVVIISHDRELPDEVVPGLNVLRADSFSGRGLALVGMTVEPSTGIGVAITSAPITEIEVTDDGTTQRATAIEIGQGYRAFVVPGLRPREVGKPQPTITAVG